MPLSRLAVQELYTKRIDRYGSFIAVFESPQGIRAPLRRSDLLHPGLRVLDAGCGFGVASFAFVEALREKNLDYKSIDAFDLTPAMLCRFQKTLEARGLPRVQLCQADVTRSGRNGISRAPSRACTREWPPKVAFSW